MKIGRKMLIFAIALGAVLIFSVIAYAVSSAYDSATDPLIAQSYLNARLDAQASEYQAKIDALTARIEALEAEDNGSTGGETVAVGAKFEAVTLAKGDVIYPASGQIELILRSGGAVTVTPEGTGTIANLTNGAELTDGKSLVRNHLIFVPAADGRGIKIVSSSGAEILIRGEYTVEHAE